MKANTKVREIVYHDRMYPTHPTQHVAVGVWGERNPEGHRTFIQEDGPPLYLFDDEIDAEGDAR